MVKYKIRYILKVFSASILLTSFIVLVFSPRIEVALQSMPDEQRQSEEGIQLSEVADGTYEASAEGHNGPITVSVQVVNHHITAVRVVDHSESEGIADQAIDQIPIAILSADDTNIDAVSGATVTSNAIKTAVENALYEATE